MTRSSETSDTRREMVRKQGARLARQQSLVYDTAVFCANLALAAHTDRVLSAKEPTAPDEALEQRLADWKRQRALRAEESEGGV